MKYVFPYFKFARECRANLKSKVIAYSFAFEYLYAHMAERYRCGQKD